MLSVLSVLFDLALPRLCVGCHAPDRHGLCARCRPCGPPILSGSLGFPVAGAGSYDGVLRTALLAYKERGRRDLAGALAELLSGALAALDVGAGAILVPVPSSRAASRERGGDHVARLARRAARRSGLPVRRPLRLVRAVRDSAGLDATARRANLFGAMSARPGGGRHAVLVDDIATTGATLAEAVRALERAGWRVCGAAVLAVTERREGPDRWRAPIHGSSVGMT